MQTRLVNAWETLNSNRPWDVFLKSSETFQVPQFFLYRRDAEVLSHQTSSSSWLFFTLKTCQKITFSKQADCSLTTGFSDTKSSRDFGEAGPC